MLDPKKSGEENTILEYPESIVTYQKKAERAKVATGKTFTTPAASPNKRVAYPIPIVTRAYSAIFDIMQQ